MIVFALRLSIRNLIRHRRRVVLVGLIVALGAAVLTVQRGLVEGIRASMLEHVVVSRFGHVRIATEGSAESGAVLEDPKLVRRVVREHVPGARVTARLSALGMAFAGDESTARIAIHASEPAAYIAGRGTAVLGAEVAAQLGLVLGDEVTLSVMARNGAIESREFEVGAVREDGAPWEAFFVYVDLADLQSMTGAGTAVGSLDLVLAGGEGSAGETAARLRPMLDGCDVTTYEETGRMYLGIIQAARIQASVVEAILLVAVGLGVAGAQLLQTHHRKREFGTMAAMGTPRELIRWMIVAEGALLALLCGAVGVMLGVASIWILDHAGVTVGVEAFRWMVGGSRLVARVSGAGIVWTMVLLMAIVGVCGLHPAARAVRLSPVEAIRRGVR